MCGIRAVLTREAPGLRSVEHCLSLKYFPVLGPPAITAGVLHYRHDHVIDNLNDNHLPQAAAEVVRAAVPTPFQDALSKCTVMAAFTYYGPYVRPPRSR